MIEEMLGRMANPRHDEPPPMSQTKAAHSPLVFGGISLAFLFRWRKRAVAQYTDSTFRQVLPPCPQDCWLMMNERHLRILLRRAAFLVDEDPRDVDQGGQLSEYDHLTRYFEQTKDIAYTVLWDVCSATAFTDAIVNDP